MKLSIISEHFQDDSSYGLAETFRRIAQIGFDGVDYTLVPVTGKKVYNPFEDEKGWRAHFKKASEEIKKNGLTCEQVHAVFPTNKENQGINFIGDEEVELMKKQIEATEILGAPYMVVHSINIARNYSDLDLDYEANMDMLSKFVPLFEKSSVSLALENIFKSDPLRDRFCITGSSTPERLCRLIDDAHSDSVVACLDTGHAHLVGVNPEAFVKILGKRLKVLHVQDCYGRGDHHNAPGCGNIDWHKFTTALAQIGYDGALNLEVSFKREMKIHPELGWDYMKYAYKAGRALINLVEKAKSTK